MSTSIDEASTWNEAITKVMIDVEPIIGLTPEENLYVEYGIDLLGKDCSDETWLKIFFNTANALIKRAKLVIEANP